MMNKLEINDVVRVLVNNKHWIKGIIVEKQNEYVTINVPTYYGNNHKMEIIENVENVRIVVETLKEMEDLKAKGFKL